VNNLLHTHLPLCAAYTSGDSSDACESSMRSNALPSASLGAAVTIENAASATTCTSEYACCGTMCASVQNFMKPVRDILHTARHEQDYSSHTLCGQTTRSHAAVTNRWAALRTRLTTHAVDSDVVGTTHRIMGFTPSAMPAPGRRCDRDSASDTGGGEMSANCVKTCASSGRYRDTAAEKSEDSNSAATAPLREPPEPSAPDRPLPLAPNVAAAFSAAETNERVNMGAGMCE
jgi:hypothetical protein